MSFQTSFNALATIPLHVTIYDLNGVALSPSNLSWLGLPAGAQAVADVTPISAGAPLGFYMTFPHTGTFSPVCSEIVGPDAQTFNFVVSAPGMQATTP